MDSITQIVLGAAMGEVALGKKAGNHAILWGAIAGTIPDLDVISTFFVDDLRASELHRGFTHSLLFCTLFALVLGWLIQRIYKDKFGTNTGDWIKLSLLALITHPLLDAHTAYGTQLFWPFDLRVAYKNINVVDPLYTVPFLILVAAAMFYRRNNIIRRKLVWTGIAVSTAYMVYTIGVKFYVHSRISKELTERGYSFERSTSTPTIFNSLLWYYVADADSSYYIVHYSLLDEPGALDVAEFHKNPDLIRELEHYPEFKRLTKQAQGWYLLDIDRNGNPVFKDIRFGMMKFDDRLSSFVFGYTLKKAGEHLQVEQVRPDFSSMDRPFESLWTRIKGVKPVIHP